MPKRRDINRILVIGSGPIIIGQACEFDYSGTQALKALKKEGLYVIVVNSNPATIMTDPGFADATYIEPLTPEVLEEIIKKERPDALLATLGGQTALNLAVKLHESGVLKKYNVELVGANIEAIKKAEDRELFRETAKNIGLDIPQSFIVSTIDEAKKAAEIIGFPLIIRPSYCLGGTGSSIVYNIDELYDAVAISLELSMIHKVLIEESIIGWKEYELEVMRDKSDNCIVICSIENFDPMGVHTGDSITVAPAQTLTDKEYQKMRDWAFKIIRAIGVETGGSNIQFAVNPKNGRMVVIEMNPRVSRSSALASKATGFPIAKIASLLAIGYNLDEIPNDITKKTPASFEPTIDYVVVKIPRFAFDKFTSEDQTLDTQMKSVGEVMAIGRTFKEALQKAIQSLEIGRYGLGADGLGRVKLIEKAIKEGGKLKEKVINEIKENISKPNCDRIFCIKYALQLGISVEEISELSKIDPWFINQIKEIVEFEEEGRDEEKNLYKFIKEAKQYGFSDYQIAYLLNKSQSKKWTEERVRNLRKKMRLFTTYKLVDTCSAEFEAYTPYYYSTYEDECEAFYAAKRKEENKIIVVGAGPNRIGQGIEFDYCCVHCVFALKEEGYKAIMINCNPETVSTDYDVSDKLYFEPLTLEKVLDVVEKEQPKGVITQFGGQTSTNLSLLLTKNKVRILGTPPESIDIAEDRTKFAKFIKALGMKMARFGSAKSIDKIRKTSLELGLPVIIRPSYVLGGRGMAIIYDERSLDDYLNQIMTEFHKEYFEKPIYIDKFIDEAIECEVDAVCDGQDILFGGVMEHIEEAGIHSGDSACVTPPFSLSNKIINELFKITQKIALKLKIKGLINIQYAIKDGEVYVLEVNPRASRTVPYLSKSIGIPLAKVATKVIIGRKLKDVITRDKLNVILKNKFYSVKEAIFPWAKFRVADPVLGPEMRSTGEVMGIDKTFPLAFYKSQLAAGFEIPTSGKILVSISDSDKQESFPIIKELKNLGFKILATHGTYSYLINNGVEAVRVKKIDEGRPNIIDIIKNKEVSLIINTPSGSKAKKDGYWIRRTAYIHGIPLITTLNAAKATLLAIKEIKNNQYQIKSLQECFT